MVAEEKIINGSLSPAEYDYAEARGCLHLTNRMIEAFSPAAFAATGYPVHVTDHQELWRYVDVMHETRLPVTVEQILEGLTRTEFDTFKRAVQFMAAFTKTEFGRQLHCENALLRAMNVYRYIKTLNPRTVLELGPGSGYLGLLLILDGIGYIACDNAQAFYLLQSRMWRAAAGENFRDLAQESGTLREALSSDLNAKVVHVPWWKIIDLDLQSLPSRIDIVSANHCLSEMQINAMKYFLRLSHKFLSDSSMGAFVFEGWGADHLHSPWEVAKQFIETGFKLCHADKKITVFSVQKSPEEQYCTLPHRISILQTVRATARRICGFPRIPYEYSVNSFEGKNKYSLAISQANERFVRERTVQNKEIMDFISDVYGCGPDMEENFLNLIGSTYN